jgi:APA family basic amino acid/polyamine antiporter
MEELGGAGTQGAQRMIEKLFKTSPDVAQYGVAAMSAVIMCSTFGAINSNMLNSPRITFAMGRDDVFFRQLGRVHVNYRTPATAILVQTLMSAGLVIVSGILVAVVEGFKQKSTFELLTNFVIFSASIFYMLAVLAVIILRRKHPDWERPYRVWGYPVVPVLYLTFYVWFLFNIYLQYPFESKTGLLLIAAGIPFYYGWRAWAKRNPDPLGDGE